MRKTQSKNTVSRDRRSVEMSTKSDGVDKDVFNTFSRLASETAQLGSEKKVLEMELSVLNHSISRAKSQAYHNGKYVEPASWKRMNDEVVRIRKKIIEIEKRLAVLKAKRSAEKDLFDVSFDSVFKEVARELLAGDIFNRLVTATVHRIKEREGHDRDRA